MIRSLVIIAVAGLVMSVACISAALAIGGPAVLAHGLWSSGHGVWWSGPHGWRWESHEGHWSGGWTSGGADQPQATRTAPWTGGDRLEIDVPADVTFTQSDGPASVTIRGPKDAVDQLVVDGGRIRLNGDADGAGQLSIAITAPKVTHFSLLGSGDLDIRNYHQDALALDLTGSGDVTAQGAAKSVQATIAGSSDADFSQLTVDGADVRISGSGSAKVGPQRWAKLDISGSGDITLLSHPPRIESHISGSGDIEQKGQLPAAADQDAGPARPA